MFSVVLKVVLLVGSVAGCYKLISETNLDILWLCFDSF